jgi:hypothetical protein
VNQPNVWEPVANRLLRKGGILHCLKELFDEVYIPKAVEIECQDQETIAEVRILG